MCDHPEAPQVGVVGGQFAGLREFRSRLAPLAAGGGAIAGAAVGLETDLPVIRPQLERRGIFDVRFGMLPQPGESPRAEHKQPRIIRWRRAVDEQPGLTVVMLDFQIVPPEGRPMGDRPLVFHPVFI